MRSLERMARSNDYSCQVEGVAKSSASTDVDARRATDVDALGVNGPWVKNKKWVKRGVA